MNILVTGASGYLGHELADHFAPHHSVSGLWRSREPRPNGWCPIQADLSGPVAIARTLRTIRPDVIIHAAAMTLAGECERDQRGAYRANVEATDILLRAAARHTPAAHFIHVSTDLVFDGRHAPYAESSPARPLSFYGTTKLMAESLVRQNPAPWTIARVALIYGPRRPRRTCFLDWTRTGLHSGKARFFEDEFRTPVCVRDLCVAFEQIARRRVTGLLHLGGATRVSRLEFARDVHRILEPDAPAPVSARRTGHDGARRPADVSMSSTRAARLLGYRPMSPAAGLEWVRHTESTVLPRTA